LGLAQGPQRLLAVVGRGDTGAVAERGEHRHAHINADRRQGGGSRFDNLVLALDGGEPLSGPAGEGDVADIARQSTPAAQPDPAELWHLAEDRPVRSTRSEVGSGKRKLSWTPRLRGVG